MSIVIRVWEIMLKMNILYISTVFPTDSSTIYTDLAEALTKRGHSVFVLAADNDAPQKICVCKAHGCKLIKVKMRGMYNAGFLKKGVATILLPMTLKKVIREQLHGLEFDLILFESPPTTLNSVVKYAKKLFKAKAFLMMKDIFPQNAVDIGIMKKNLIYAYFKTQEKKLYEISDIIGCMSKGNMDYLAKHSNVPYDKMIIFPNTKKINERIKKDTSTRFQYGIPASKVVFVFGGNMGKPQGMEFLANAIKACQGVRDAFFLLVGRGTEKAKVSKILEGNSNYIILDNLPRDSYEELVACCDVGIISLDERFTIPNYPSRILSYMEFALPVIVATDVNTDFKDLIQESGCGYWMHSNSIDCFVDLVNKMTQDAVGREKMGIAGRQYIEKNLNVNISVDLIENCMSSNIS